MNIFKKIIDIISVIAFAIMVIIMVALTILFFIGMFAGIISLNMTDLVYVIISSAILLLILNGFIVFEDWLDNHVIFKH